jgi:uncharacterized protein YcbK (DUF882 family)
LRNHARRLFAHRSRHIPKAGAAAVACAMILAGCVSGVTPALESAAYQPGIEPASGTAIADDLGASEAGSFASGEQTVRTSGVPVPTRSPLVAPQMVVAEGDTDDPGPEPETEVGLALEQARAAGSDGEMRVASLDPNAGTASGVRQERPKTLFEMLFHRNGQPIARRGAATRSVDPSASARSGVILAGGAAETATLPAQDEPTEFANGDAPEVAASTAVPVFAPRERDNGLALQVAGEESELAGSAEATQMQLASVEPSAGAAQETRTLQEPVAQPQEPTKPKSLFEVLFGRKQQQRAASARLQGQARDRAHLRETVPGGPDLPGVKSGNELFSISGEEGNAEEDANSTRLASLGGLGRLSPNGLRVQTERVEVACLKPELVALLRQVERHYRKPVIVTSGYRSPVANRKAGGASGSMHIQCKAADIQVEGVSKWDLAKFMRTMPGRGGVGTYCRTESVHIDTGEERDWHYPCGRFKKSAKKA